MIAVAGGSGRLGTRLVARLVAGGAPVRVLTREPERARRALPAEAAVVRADVTRPSSLAAALEGADTVVSAITGFGGPGAGGADTVDRDGNLALIAAAENAGVRHFILVSVEGATTASPVRLFRAKAAAEQRLASSRLAGSVVRPTAYLELWLDLVGRPLAETGRTRVFGGGRNPVNFVAVDDVAAVVARIASDGRAVEPVTVAGPESLTFDDLVGRVAAACGVEARIDHVPARMLRAASLLLGPVRPVLADQMRASLMMDGEDLRVDPADRMRRFPDLPVTPPDAVIRARFGPQASALARAAR